MASYNRTRRIAEEIRKVVSTMLINGVKDPRITSMVSVTDVEVTNDLRYAYVYVSILGGDEESTLTGLIRLSIYIPFSIESSSLNTISGIYLSFIFFPTSLLIDRKSVV